MKNRNLSRRDIALDKARCEMQELVNRLVRTERERDAARALVDLGIALLRAGNCPEAAHELARRRNWLPGEGSGRGAERGGEGER